MFVPIVAGTLAIFLLAVATEFQVELGFLGLIIYGLANSILTVLFIVPFRRHAFKTLVCWWLKPILKCLKLDNLIQERRATMVKTPVFYNNNFI